MRASIKKIIGPLSVAVMLCAPVSIAPRAQAALLDIADLVVAYDVHSPSSATGTLEFNLRFNSLNGDLGGYDLFSAQLMLTNLFGGSSATFVLNETAMEATSASDPAYWLSGVSTSYQNASTQGGEYRFSDFVSMSLAFTPSPGDIVARFVFDFEITAADQFGEYEIAQSVSGPNYFKSDFVNTFDDTTPPRTFVILVPEPASGLMVCLAGAALLAARRRRRR